MTPLARLSLAVVPAVPPADRGDLADDLDTCTRCEAQTDNPTATWPRLLGVPREILCPTCAAELEPVPPEHDTREEYLASRGRD